MGSPPPPPPDLWSIQRFQPVLRLTGYVPLPPVPICLLALALFDSTTPKAAVHNLSAGPAGRITHLKFTQFDWGHIHVKPVRLLSVATGPWCSIRIHAGLFATAFRAADRFVSEAR